MRNGYNVYPNEVEQVLLRHPGVVNAAVFGVAPRHPRPGDPRRRHPPRCGPRHRRADRVRARPHRRLQVPPRRAPRRRAAAGSVGQGAEARARGAVPARAYCLVRPLRRGEDFARVACPRVPSLRSGALPPDPMPATRSKVPPLLRSVRRGARGTAHQLLVAGAAASATRLETPRSSSTRGFETRRAARRRS